MGKITVILHRVLVEDSLKTGRHNPGVTIIDGLPPKARLVYAGLDIVGNLEMHFEAEDEDRTVCIKGILDDGTAR